jgi:hypothetical protein
MTYPYHLQRLWIINCNKANIRISKNMIRFNNYCEHTKYVDMPSSYTCIRVPIRTGVNNRTNTLKCFPWGISMLHTHQCVNHLKAHISHSNESCRRITKREPKWTKCAVTPCSSSKCLNVIMVAEHLLHVFTKWHRHTLFKSSPTSRWDQGC